MPYSVLCTRKSQKAQAQRAFTSVELTENLVDEVKNSLEQASLGIGLESLSIRAFRFEKFRFPWENSPHIAYIERSQYQQIMSRSPSRRLLRIGVLLPNSKSENHDVADAIVRRCSLATDIQDFTDELNNVYFVVVGDASIEEFKKSWAIATGRDYYASWWEEKAAYFSEIFEKIAKYFCDLFFINSIQEGEDIPLTDDTFPSVPFNNTSNSNGIGTLPRSNGDTLASAYSGKNDDNIEHNDDNIDPEDAKLIGRFKELGHF